MKARALTWLPLVACFALIALSLPFLWAGEVEILNKKLVEKGILTQEDADSIIEEIRQEIRSAGKERPAPYPDRDHPGVGQEQEIRQGSAAEISV